LYPFAARYYSDHAKAALHREIAHRPAKPHHEAAPALSSTIAERTERTQRDLAALGHNQMISSHKGTKITKKNAAEVDAFASWLGGFV